MQEEPISRSAYPITPLPTAWWESPVTAENVQEWYKISGPWLGISPNDFAATGGLGLNNGFENNVCNHTHPTYSLATSSGRNHGALAVFQAEPTVELKAATTG